MFCVHIAGDPIEVLINKRKIKKLSTLFSDSVARFGFQIMQRIVFFYTFFLIWMNVCAKHPILKLLNTMGYWDIGEQGIFWVYSTSLFISVGKGCREKRLRERTSAATFDEGKSCLWLNVFHPHGSPLFSLWIFLLCGRECRSSIQLYAVAQDF